MRGGGRVGLVTASAQTHRDHETAVAVEHPAFAFSVVTFAAGEPRLRSVVVSVGPMAGVAALVEGGVNGRPLGDCLVTFPA
jgi:hypothetical protein